MQKYDFVARVSLPVQDHLSLSYVSIFANSANYFGFLVREVQTDKLMLPVRTGGPVSLRLDNNVTTMGAFPARLGNERGEWTNLFPACPVTDLATMPAIGGMIEVFPNRLHSITGPWPTASHEPFTAINGKVVTNGIVCDRIEVGYRSPKEPNRIPGMPEDATPRGGGFTGPVTGVEYLEEARSFTTVHLVDRRWMADELTEDGLAGLRPEIDRDWSKATIEDCGLRASDILLSEAAA